MNKCQKCGKEYEGNFCPSCGEKNKGGNINSYAKASSGNIKYFPCVALALFSVLLFAFFAAPVAVVPLFKVSVGTVYSLLNEELIDKQLKDISITLIVFAVLTFIYAVWTIYLKYKNKTEYVVETLSGNKVAKQSKGYDIFGMLLYIPFIIIGIVICAYDNAQELTVGACPVLLIVFSIIFAIAEGIGIYKIN